VQRATQQEQLDVASMTIPGMMALVAPIAEAPLFSDEEQALYDTLPPEQQAMMTLQARRQREGLMTSLLSNLMNARHR
jgi:hypothetical protein